MFIAELVALNRGISDGINGKNNNVYEDEAMYLSYGMGQMLAARGLIVRFFSADEMKWSRLKTMLMLGEEKLLKIRVRKVRYGYEGYVCTMAEGFEDIFWKTPYAISNKDDAIDWADRLVCHLKAELGVE